MLPFVKDLIRIVFHGLALDEVPQPRSLMMLPADVILLIYDFLPISSTTCLSLCSRQFLNIVENKAWHDLRSRDASERKEFSSMLKKDLSNWSLCHRCSIFHLAKELETFYRKCSILNDAVEFRNFDISFERAQKVMNRYRFGRSYLRALGYLSDVEILYSADGDGFRLSPASRSWMRSSSFAARTHLVWSNGTRNFAYDVFWKSAHILLTKLHLFRKWYCVVEVMQIKNGRLAINAHHESPWKCYSVKNYRFESTWKEIWVLARLLLILNGEDR